ncbi:MAG TPA: GNAT family N-acetyltransferase [Thermodesulfobacteriota bacterium]|nr:GNAT family N-acetyltransferase [Thermodesulfobacteriota bacterium]
MRETIKTRRIRLEDIPRIVSIHESIRKKRVSEEWLEATGKRALRGQRIGFVAIKNRQVVGFIFGEIKGEGFGLEQSGWIEFVGVEPSHMGIGIGQAMVSRLLDFFRKKKIRDVYTAVQWDSVDMLSFFKSLGFDRSPFINLKKRLD